MTTKTKTTSQMLAAILAALALAVPAMTGCELTTKDESVDRNGEGEDDDEGEGEDDEGEDDEDDEDEDEDEHD